MKEVRITEYKYDDLGKVLEIIESIEKFYEAPKGSPCDGCSNNPSNGGSGVCHCTLGLPVIS